MLWLGVLEENGPFVFRPRGFLYPESRNDTRLKLDPSDKYSVITSFTLRRSTWKIMAKPTGV